MNLYNIEKEEKNLCVQKCFERRWIMILYLCWRWSWFLYYVCDPLSSIFLWIHFFVVVCYLFFKCHVACDLTCVVEECANGVHKHGVICNVFLIKSLSMQKRIWCALCVILKVVALWNMFIKDWLFFIYKFCGCTIPKPSIHDKGNLQICPNFNHVVNVPFYIVMCITINHL